MLDDKVTIHMYHFRSNIITTMLIRIIIMYVSSKSNNVIVVLEK